mgnify:CR=1 FL=1
MLRMEQTTSSAERVSAHVGQRIKDSGVSIVWLCEHTGIPRSTMLRRLSGHSAFNLNELDRIAVALRLSTADLLQVAS